MAQLARVRAERERLAPEAAEGARRLRCWEDCGLPEAAGLRPACASQRRVDGLVREAVDLAVVVGVDLSDTVAVGELIQRCEADTRALLAAPCARACGTDADSAVLAYTAPQVARRIRDERRQAALRRLARSPEAVAEADAVYAAYRRRHNRRTKEAAEQAADAAGLRTAEALLGRLLDQLDAARRRASAA